MRRGDSGGGGPARGRWGRVPARREWGRRRRRAPGGARTNRGSVRRAPGQRPPWAPAAPTRQPMLCLWVLIRGPAPAPGPLTAGSRGDSCGPERQPPRARPPFSGRGSSQARPWNPLQPLSAPQPPSPQPCVRLSASTSARPACRWADPPGAYCGHQQADRGQGVPRQGPGQRVPGGPAKRLARAPRPGAPPQVGNACWELYCLEHGIQPDGQVRRGPGRRGAGLALFNFKRARALASSMRPQPRSSRAPPGTPGLRAPVART